MTNKEEMSAIFSAIRQKLIDRNWLSLEESMYSRDWLDYLESKMLSLWRD